MSSMLPHRDNGRSPADSPDLRAASRGALKKRAGLGLVSSELLHQNSRRSPVDGPTLPAASRRCHRSYRGGCSFGEAEDFGLDGKKG